MNWRTHKTRQALKEALNSGLEIIVFDTETTGLSSDRDRIIQISGIKFIVKDGRLKEVGRLDECINPEREVSPKITEITGFTNEFLSKQPTEREIFPKVYEFFGENPIIAAYNSNFDIRFITQMYIRNNKPFKAKIDLDVLKMAKDLIHKDDVDDYKLGTIASYLYCDRGLTFHKAIDDTIATSRLLAVFIEKYKKLEEEEINKPAPVKRVATFIDSRFWKGYRGYSRVYVNTDLGSVYYDIRNKEWGAKDCDLETVDMEQLREDVFTNVGVSCEEELARVMKK